MNILLVYGGGSSEHEISILSAKFLKEKIQSIPNINLFCVEIEKDGNWTLRLNKNNHSVVFNKSNVLLYNGQQKKIDFVIPYMHGYPTETGDFQSFLELQQVPYLGAGPEANTICFNKITTKLWLDVLDIPNVPFLTLPSMEKNDLNKALKFSEKHNDIFVKASNQGSSVGCYHVTETSQLKKAISDAFQYSSYVLLEKTITGRELEIAVYEYDGKIHTSSPGEILLPDNQFYSYKEKYSDTSNTKCSTKAQGISKATILKMQEYAKQAFKGLKLKHLCRVDFFLDSNETIYLNEINTFPGMTSISLFPKMIQANGHKIEDFLQKIITSN